MGKKKSPKIEFPEMEAMLEGMHDLLKDEYGNPLPPNHPHFEKFKKIAQQISDTLESTDESEADSQFKGHA